MDVLTAHPTIPLRTKEKKKVYVKIEFSHQNFKLEKTYQFYSL